MTVRYAVTFEFDTRAPVTHRGTIAGGSGATCASRATRIAQKVLRPVNWSSMVCVLLERLDGPVRADGGSTDVVDARSADAKGPDGGDREKGSV